MAATNANFYYALTMRIDNGIAALALGETVCATASGTLRLAAENADNRGSSCGATMQDRPTRAANILSVYLGTLFISYCTVYLCACPSVALATAIGAEVIVLAISIVIMRAHIFTLPERLTKFIPERARTCIHTVNRYAQSAKLIALSVVALLATVEFMALSLSALKMHRASITVYTLVPTSYWLGLHPAFSLEMLAGALVEKGNYAAAEPLYQSLLNIRLQLCGPRSDLAGAIYCDLGDLYMRMHQLPAAEQWYRRSVALGARTGRAYTALATALREQGRLQESQQLYLQALDIRRRVYGAGSKQYADTLRGYSRAQQMQHIDRSSI